MTPGAAEDAPAPGRLLGLTSAGALVVASMIGAGIFTTTGILAQDLGRAGILAVWVLGGALALGAALSFGELGAMMPGPGAEVRYLRRTFGPQVGFAAGVVTFVAGMVGSVAAVASALGSYAEALLPGLPGPVAGSVVILALCALHAHGVQAGARFNDLACAFKLLFLAAFIAVGLWSAPAAAAMPPRPDGSAAAFAHGLVQVAFAYTGWNAAAYVAGEIRDPARLLPRSLFLGTALVTVLYVLANLVFLRAASPAELAGVEAVGHFTAVRLLGEAGGRWFSAGIVVVLVSTLSSFIMAGPRVLVAMAEDGDVPAVLGRSNPRGAPSAAVAVLGACSLAFLWTVSLDDLLAYVGYLLTLSAALAVTGLLVLRRRAPEVPRPYRVPLYPWLPLAFIALSAWMLVQAAQASRETAIGGAATLAACLVLRPLLRRGAAARIPSPGACARR